MSNCTLKATLAFPYSRVGSPCDEMFAHIDMYKVRSVPLIRSVTLWGQRTTGFPRAHELQRRIPTCDRDVRDPQLTPVRRRIHARNFGIHGKRKACHTRTACRRPDLADCDFTATAPNRLWGADFCYVRTNVRFCYTAFVNCVLSTFSCRSAEFFRPCCYFMRAWVTRQDLPWWRRSGLAPF